MTGNPAHVRTYRGAPVVRYTAHADPRVEELVRKHLDRIVDAVSSRIAPKAMVLTGSFGRGEGSARIDSDRVQVISDYEVAVVTWKAWKRDQIVRLSEKLSKELDVEVSLFWVTPGRVKHNRMKNLSFGNPKPTRFMYDFKAGSTVLYGYVNLWKNRLTPSDIPPWEGLRMIFNRLGEFLFQVDREGFRRWVEGRDNGESLPIPKSLLSAMNALLVASGQFEPSTGNRLRSFLTHNAFDVNLDGLPEALKNAADHRVHGVPWLGVPLSTYRRFVFDSLRILLQETFEFRLDDMAGFPSGFHPGKKFQCVAVQYEAGWLPVNQIAFERMIQTLKLRRAGLGHELRRFKNNELLPSIVMQSLIPGMVLLSENGSLKSILDGFEPSGFSLDDIVTQYSDDWDRWDAIRHLIYPLWKTIC